jgi:CDP-diacylglycerol--glycerol-3-phosphate 3-phosphatidyltransferase
MKEEHKNTGRKILSPITNLFVKLDVTPNVLTVSSLPLSILACYFFSQGHRWIGGIFLLIIGLFDTIDGEVARKSGKLSKYGAFLDSVMDRFAEFFIFLGFFLYYTDQWISILIFSTIFSSLLVSYVRARAEGIGEECKIGFMERPMRFAIMFFGVFFLGYRLLPIAFSVILIGNVYTIIQRILYVIRKKNL